MTAVKIRVPVPLTRRENKNDACPALTSSCLQHALATIEDLSQDAQELDDKLQECFLPKDADSRKVQMSSVYLTKMFQNVVFAVGAFC